MARGFPLRSVGSKSQAGLPRLSHQRPISTQITSSCEKCQVSLCQGQMALVTESHLKGQCTKIHLQPLTLSSSKGRAERLEESLGMVALGRELKEQLPVPCAVLSHLPHCRNHLSQAEHSPPSGISLRESNSPAHRNCTAPFCGA